MDWTHPAQDREQCLALLNMVKDLQVPLKTGNFRIFSSLEYSVLQALQFQEVSVRCVLPGGTGISYN
jgi:hypothetical protein